MIDILESELTLNVNRDLFPLPNFKRMTNSYLVASQDLIYPFYFY